MKDLQNLCINTIVQHWRRLSPVLELPPEYNIQILETCIEQENVDVLQQILLSKELLLSLLTTVPVRKEVYCALQLVVDSGTPIQDQIVRVVTSKDVAVKLQVRVGAFLMESGWYESSRTLLEHILKGTHRPSILSALTLLIPTYIALCDFTAAESTFQKAQDVLVSVTEDGECCASRLYAEECYRHYCQSNFLEAEHWADKAIEEVNGSLSAAHCISVLRRTAKVYINTRQFGRAQGLIRHAVGMASVLFGEDHPGFAEALQDYGFCLLHLDMNADSVEVYRKAVNIIDAIYGEGNVKSALAHEDLAYALYVQDYNSGDYVSSLHHSNTAVRIVLALLPSAHLLHASTSRLRALILEELAFDQQNLHVKTKILKEAEELHSKSLKLCRSVLGEDNIQTAKHYGNLGRLYQTMGQHRAAEKMHRRAIKIKESLLGPDNFELALSLGHLASLYNYDMCRYGDAVPLYNRSIRIALRLFGPGFSGLEYDYRGLIYLYTATDQVEEQVKYMMRLQEWQEVRDEVQPCRNSTSFLAPPQPTAQLLASLPNL